MAITELGHFIGGTPVAGASGRTGPVHDPATGRQTGAVALASVAEVDDAVAIAAAAFDEWRTTSLAVRSKLLFRLRHLVDANADELARRITAEHGKVHGDALGEVARGLENIDYACNVGELLLGGHSHQVSSGVELELSSFVH